MNMHLTTIWNNARTTVPEDSDKEILCYRGETEKSIVTIGKLANGTIKWAFVKDLIELV